MTQEIKDKISKLEKAIASPVTPEQHREAMKAKIAELRAASGEGLPVTEKGKKKVAKVMKEFKDKKLTTHGKKVTKVKQAKAIALSEGRAADVESKPAKKAHPKAASGKNFENAIIISAGTRLNAEFTDIAIDLDGEEEETVSRVRFELDDAMDLPENKRAKAIKDIVSKLDNDWTSRIESPSIRDMLIGSIKNFWDTVKLPSKKKSAPEKKPNCDELLEEYEKRRAAYKASNKKRKKITPSEKVGKGMATAVKAVVKNAGSEQWKKPEFATKVKTLADELDSAFSKFRSSLGEDYDRDEFETEFAEVYTMIDKLKKKYAK